MNKQFAAGFLSSIAVIIVFAAVAIAMLDPPAPSNHGRFIVKSDSSDGAFLTKAAAELNAHMNIAEDFTLKYTHCDKPEIYHRAREKEIVVCDAAFEQAQKLLSDKEQAERAMTFVLYHETAHALIDMYDIPFTGREEDVADQFATYMLVEQGQATTALAAAQRYRAIGTAKSKLYLWDDHSLEEQRYYNINCWVYGSNTFMHSSLVKSTPLPKQRAEQCADEYDRIESGVQTLFASYVR